MLKVCMIIVRASREPLEIEVPVRPGVRRKAPNGQTRTPALGFSAEQDSAAEKGRAFFKHDKCLNMKQDERSRATFMEQSKSCAFCFASLKIAGMAIFRGSFKPCVPKRHGFMQSARGDDGEPRPRMNGEQPQQLHAGIAGTADDADLDHGAPIEEESANSNRHCRRR